MSLACSSTLPWFAGMLQLELIHLGANLAVLQGGMELGVTLQEGLLGIACGHALSHLGKR